MRHSRGFGSISAHTTFGILVFLLLGALIVRIHVLQGLAYEFLNCRWCIVTGVINADIPFLGVLAWIFLLGLMTPKKGFSIGLRTLAVLGLILYVADIAVMSQFVVRLTLVDLRTYLAQPVIIWRHLATFSALHLSLATLGLLGLIALATKQPSGLISRRGVSVWSASLVGLVLINPVAFPAPSLVHDWAIRNVIHANLPTGVQRDYSQDTRARLENAYLADAKKMRCRPGRNSHDHILLVVLESWSAYHSAYWSGLNDWTPRLDDIARSALSFMRLHAAGPNTMEGLMAMFTGRDFALPLARPYTAAPFESAWGLPDSLPRRLRLEGYHTVFLTSGNLGFTKTGEWLKDIGFNYVEGHEYSGYTGISRHHFESVPDDVLFNRALEFINQYDKNNPVFMVVETVSSHHPFLHPYTGERSEEAAIRYMDQAAADFIEALGARGYFNNGILVVVSDHRAMTIVPRSESRRLGKGAASQIPGFIMTGNNKERQVDRLFHQADLMPTLFAHVSSEFCYSGPIRDMIEPSDSESRCVLHARGDRRDHIDVFCEEGSGTVVVDGDASRFVEVEDLSQDTQELMLDKIAWHRIQAETE